MKSKKVAGVIATAMLVAASAGQALEIGSYTIDAGGGRSSATRHSVSGTVGQADAHPSIGSRFSLDGGFWPAPDFTPPADSIFADGYE